MLCRDWGFIRSSDPTVVAFVRRGSFKIDRRRGARIKETIPTSDWRSRGIDLLPIGESDALRKSVQETASGLSGADEWITFRRLPGEGDYLEPVTLAAFLSGA